MRSPRLLSCSRKWLLLRMSHVLLRSRKMIVIVVKSSMLLMTCFTQSTSAVIAHVPPLKPYIMGENTLWKRLIKDVYHNSSLPSFGLPQSRLDIIHTSWGIPLNLWMTWFNFLLRSCCRDNKQSFGLAWITSALPAIEGLLTFKASSATVVKKELIWFVEWLFQNHNEWQSMISKWSWSEDNSEEKCFSY